MIYLVISWMSECWKSKFPNLSKCHDQHDNNNSLTLKNQIPKQQLTYTHHIHAFMYSLLYIIKCIWVCIKKNFKKWNKINLMMYFVTSWLSKSWKSKFPNLTKCHDQHDNNSSLHQKTKFPNSSANWHTPYGLIPKQHKGLIHQST